jgi:CHAT domain-containing protein/Flp pilus assembly protein TadD
MLNIIIMVHRRWGALDLCLPLVFSGLFLLTSLLSPLTAEAQVRFGIGGGFGGAGIKVEPGSEDGPISIEVGAGPLGRIRLRPRVVDKDVTDKDLKKEDDYVFEESESEESTRARTFLVQADMGIDPKLIADVRKDPKGTLKKYLEVLKTAKRKRNIEDQRNALVYIGNIYYLQGLFNKGADHFSQALKFYQEANDLNGEALMTNSLGAVKAASGRYDEARKLYESAMLKFKAAGNTPGESMTLNNLAVLAKIQGRFAKAVNRFEHALKIGAKEDEARILKLENLGKINAGWGQYEQGVQYLNDALRISRKLTKDRLQADLLVSQGKIYLDWGKSEKALENFKKALSIAKKQKERLNSFNYLIGSVYLDLGDVKEAEPFMKASKANAGLGRLSLMKSDYKGATKYYAALRRSAERSSSPRSLFTAYTGLGTASEGLKDLRGAEKDYAKAMDIVEEIRSSLLMSERRNFFAVPIHGFLPSEPAKGLIRVRLKANKGDKTILPGELTRAREFAARIAQRADVSDLNVPKSVTDEEEALYNQLASLKKARAVVPRRSDPQRFDTITRQIRSLERKLKSFSRDLRKKYKAYAEVRSPRPVPLNKCVIRPEEFIVVFDCLGQGVGVKLIKGKKVLHASYVEWDEKQLKEAVRRFRRPFEQVDLRAFDPKLARQLYDRLLSTALAKVPRGTPVMIVPDGALAVLPFEALVLEGNATWKQGPSGPYPEGLTYLGDAYPVSYLQSVTALTLARTTGRKAKPGGKLLVMADPVFQLRDARAQATRTVRISQRDQRFYPKLMATIEETSGGSFRFERLALTQTLAENLRTLYHDQSDVYTGLDATKKEFLDKIAPKLGQYGKIVFATHGLFSNRIPGVTEPFIALTMVPPGTDGFLRMSEVMGLKINADVVALTACQTGLGEELSGEGVMSMGRAFQYAGAKAVLMSLWSVAEKPSIMITEGMLRHMKDGKPKLAALKLARDDVRNEGFRHPFFWASFILVGEVD